MPERKPVSKRHDELSVAPLPRMIDRVDYLAAIRLLGIDPDSTFSITLNPEIVTATAKVLDSDGVGLHTDHGYLKQAVDIPVVNIASDRNPNTLMEPDHA